MSSSFHILPAAVNRERREVHQVLNAPPCLPRPPLLFHRLRYALPLSTNADSEEYIRPMTRASVRVTTTYDNGEGTYNNGEGYDNRR